MMVRQLTEASGSWSELSTELLAVVARDEPAEYLVVIGRKDQH